MLGSKEIKDGAKILEDPELDGKFRNREEETKESRHAPAFKYTLVILSKLCY